MRLIALNALAPVPHADQDGRKRMTKARQLIFHLRRHFRKDSAVYDPVSLQLPELQSQHPWCRCWNEPAKCVEAQLSFQQMKKDYRFPNTPDDRKRCFHRAACFADISTLAARPDTIIHDTTCQICTYFFKGQYRPICSALKETMPCKVTF